MSIPRLSLVISLCAAAACADDDEPRLSVVASLDAQRGELPEGVATHAGTTYVGLFGLSRVLAIDAGKPPRELAALPPGPDGTTFVLGMTADPTGELLVVYASMTDAVTTGVYRIPASGGTATLHATHPALVVANDVERAPDGTLYVSDSTGSIFRAPPGGELVPWTSDPLLAPGGELPCGPLGSDIPLGANGIAFDGDSLLVTNTEHASILRVPIGSDGSPGAAQRVAGPDCEQLFGIDGIAVDGDGRWYAAVQRTHAIVRGARDGTFNILAAGGLLDSPASVALDDAAARLVITSSAFESARQPDATPRPAVLALEL